MSGAEIVRARFVARRIRRPRRRGAALVLAAALMIVAMAMLAFCVDLGYIITVRSEMKRATDAAALAGAAVLVDSQQEAELEAFEYLVRNPVGKRLWVEDPDWEQRLAELTAQNDEKYDVEVGHWDPATRTFVVSSELPSTLRITAVHDNVPLFFGRFFRPTGNVSVRTESIARYQPRDIVLVLDFSGSMTDDSELKRIVQFGETVRSRVETNLQQIWQELGPPSYGSLPFTPQYLTVEGQPASGCIPHITVTFRSNDVYVQSTKDLSNVVLQFSDGTTQKFDGLSGTTGTFRGTGGNSNKRIDRLWVKSGCNESGEGPGYGERFEDTAAVIKQAFGLSSVPYPYASGSWDDYINYVKTNSNVRGAGYCKKYGGMTLINYWLEKKPAASQTADLWKVSAQPIGSVKEASVLFLDYLREVDIEDRVAFVIYNSSSQTAKLEHPLTLDLDAVQSTIQHRQAAHYDPYTNIGAGIEYARRELETNARMGSFKMIVLMTDGMANRPSPDPVGKVRSETALVAAHRWPILTISLGDEADAALMQEVADTTCGAHFNIPGGGTVNDYTNQLRAVFRQIADHRPLVLVK